MVCDTYTSSLYLAEAISGFLGTEGKIKVHGNVDLLTDVWFLGPLTGGPDAACRF